MMALVQELALRFLVPLPELRNFNRISYMALGSPVQDVSAIRSVRLVNISVPDDASFIQSLNEYGFRDRRWRLEKAPRTTRVMFVGDSFVEGAMVTDENTIPRVFEKLAGAAGRRVEAMNFGVAAAHTSAFCRLLDDAAPWFRPDWVVLVFFANDLAESRGEHVESRIERWRADRPRLLEIARMLRDQEMLPFRWSLHKVRMNQPVPHPNNPFSDRSYEDFVKSFVSRRFIEVMKGGGFNPYRPGCSWWYEVMLQRPVDVSGELAFLKGLLAEGRSRLLVAYIPERRQVSNYYALSEREYSPDDFDLTQPRYQAHQRQLAEQCAALDIPFVDLTRPIAEAERQGRHLYWQYDDHLKAEGNRVAAAALFAVWKSLQQP